MFYIKVGIGQDSHKFDTKNNKKPLILGGVIIPDGLPLMANSDGDVILHALTNAVSGITGVNILGKIADDLCHNRGIKDSSIYLKESLKYLKNEKINHVSISVECSKPKLSEHIETIRKNISELLDISISSVGITATSGEELTDFGRGYGIQVFTAITTI
jgi:2-C-methyl-D-erythritol 2,4-cyclodiphosphate synthase